jgi:hypothetical protein
MFVTMEQSAAQSKKEKTQEVTLIQTYYSECQLL